LFTVTGTGCTSAESGVKTNMELVDRFCYLGDMLSVDGDNDAAVEAGVWVGWSGFVQLVSLLTNKDIIDGEREIVQQLCARWCVVWNWEVRPGP